MMTVKLGDGRLIAIQFRHFKVKKVEFAVKPRTKDPKGTLIDTRATWCQIFNADADVAKKDMKIVATGMVKCPITNDKVETAIIALNERIDLLEKAIGMAQRPIAIARTLVDLNRQRDRLMLKFNESLSRGFDRERYRKLALREALAQFKLGEEDRCKVWLIYFGRSTRASNGQHRSPSNSIRFMADALNKSPDTFIEGEVVSQS